MIFDDTICALASSGQGAIALIRVSGPASWAIVDKLFVPAGKTNSLKELPPNHIQFGEIIDNEELVDEVLLSLFKAPHSYTGEDAIEISCHGSPYIIQRITALLVKGGARMARAGEYTQRAFLNGKMDLSQAEAVADLIAAESEGAHRVALQQMRGGYSEKLKSLRDKLLHFISMVELELDFSEEDVEFADRSELSRLVGELRAVIGNLSASFQLGNALKNGVPVAIVGRPNVGKSTLLNALLNEEKAIVSDIEGTTRDAIEDTMVIEGISFRFIDTAGIRESAEPIEKLGIRRTYQKIEQAAIVLLLAEASDEPGFIRKSMEALRKQLDGKNKMLIVVLNKADLVGKEELEDNCRRLQLADDEQCISLSAAEGSNLEKLTAALLKGVQQSTASHQDIIVSNLRHFEALQAAEESLTRVSEGLETSLPTDLLAQDIREALHHLGEITGEVTTDEILGNIFKNFCIGK